MDLEEYRGWLKENGNKEEAAAYEVAKRIVNYHTVEVDADLYVKCYPRRVFQTEKERLEFDLVIEVEWESNRKYKRLIGVEFKEYDADKVVVQAIAKRPFVNYMYVATRNILMDPVNILRLSDFGIGWVVWEIYTDSDETFTKIIFPAKYNRHGDVYGLLRYLASRAIEEVLEEKMLEGKIAKNMSLLEFM